MKHNPHKPIELVIRILFACCFVSTGCVFCWSGLIELSPNQDTTMFILALISILFGLSSFASFFYSIRNLASTVIIEETGMTFCQFGKVKASLPWKQIQFVGCCSVDSYRGTQKRYCFAGTKLTEEEQKDIDLIKTPIIYFSWLAQNELDYIRSHCPVPLDDAINQFLRGKSCC